MCNQPSIPTEVESKSAGMEAIRDKPNHANTHPFPKTQELAAMVSVKAEYRTRLKPRVLSAGFKALKSTVRLHLPSCILYN